MFRRPVDPLTFLPTLFVDTDVACKMVVHTDEGTLDQKGHV